MTTETQPLPTDALPDERAAFEARFPVPGGVSWSGSRYVVKDDYINSYRCDRFIGQWAAWQARASRGQAPAGAVERGDLSTPCPHCHAGPYYLCGHYQNPVARQAPSVPEDAAQGYERRHAIRQGHEIATSDAYFDARPQIDSNDHRKVFRAGFERGWDAALAAKKGEAT